MRDSSCDLVVADFSELCKTRVKQTTFLDWFHQEKICD